MGNSWESTLNKAYPEISDSVLREMLYKIRFVCLLYRNGARSFYIYLSRGMRDISKESQTGMLVSEVNFHFLKWLTRDVANLL